jgi:DNA-binding XRE family transcriptional regulator
VQEGAKNLVLTPRQRLAAQHVASGRTHKEAAELVGVTAKTMSAWNKQPDFRRAVAEGLQVELGDIGMEALQTMVRLMRSSRSERVQQMAARDLLTRAGVSTAEADAAGGVQVVFAHMPRPGEAEKVEQSQ